MAEKVRENANAVQQEALRVETIEKELKHLVLHTEFRIDPLKQEFIEAYRRAREVPAKKYDSPQTENQEIGWFLSQMSPSDLIEKRSHFVRRMTDITILQETALRASQGIRTQMSKE